MMDWQEVAVIVVVAAAVGVALWRTVRAFRSRGSDCGCGCDGCGLKDRCDPRKRDRSGR
ncbi:MAG: FeoB-associated Cys-rich membrane protein [Clostridium sp.]|nr:FeoB-associated Cys-rich membrane protein [Clostridium sp.]